MEQPGKSLYFWHIFRYKGLLLTVLESCVGGRTPKGRKRVQLLDDLINNRSYEELKRLAEDRRRWIVTVEAVEQHNQLNSYTLLYTEGDVIMILYLKPFAYRGVVSLLVGRQTCDS